ncbi:MAG: hypothetical protein CXX71_02660 [Methanobacteriota archaeon]|nr:MAG: hypothetical protein CXX71_02660 [Euryarchaeota archaeon]
MDAWDVVVIGGTVAGMRAAIAAHDAGASVALFSGRAHGSDAGAADTGGLAASVGEATSRAHRDDTIRAGRWLSDQDVAAARTSAAFGELAQLERWGLVLRRDGASLPLLQQLPGHSEPRVASTGDSTGRELHQLLEEQCIKRGIPRRVDMQAVSLAMQDGSACGAVFFDVQDGELVSVTVILASDGFQSAWNGDGVGDGTGAWLALGANIALRDMEFSACNPLNVETVDLSLPLTLIDDGAKVRLASGGDVEFEADSGLDAASQLILSGGELCVLDARVLKRTSRMWYSDTAERVQSRCGLALDADVLPLAPRVELTIGGVPTDGTGNVTSGEEPVEGLFAAGGCCNSGFHGADIVAGNHLLDSLVGGAVAGASAATAAASVGFGSPDAVRAELSAAGEKVAHLLHGADEGALTRAAGAFQLASVMSEFMGLERDAASLEAAAARISEISAGGLQLSDSNPVMNTELVEVLRLEGLLKLSAAAVASALHRAESRGSHQRSDHPERDDADHLQHTLVDASGNVSDSSVNQGSGDDWLLAPSE